MIYPPLTVVDKRFRIFQQPKIPCDKVDTFYYIIILLKRKKNSI